MSYVGKVKAGANDYPVVSTGYGTCTTAAATAEKAVTMANFDTLLEGVTIHVLFQNSNTAASPTLNVNSTGAKTIYIAGVSAPGTTASASWDANSVVSFTYDGTYWRMNDAVKAVRDDVASIVRLPAVSGSDNGKALLVDNGAWAAGNIPAVLPAVTSADNGKVLKVDSGDWGVGTDNDSKSTALSLTLSGVSWSSATPPTQTVTATGVTASSNIVVGIASTATSAQYDEACAAKLLCTAQGTDSITITCYGDTPTGDIPISVVILG